MWSVLSRSLACAVCTARWSILHWAKCIHRIHKIFNIIPICLAYTTLPIACVASTTAINQCANRKRCNWIVSDEPQMCQMAVLVIFNAKTSFQSMKLPARTTRTHFNRWLRWWDLPRHSHHFSDAQSELRFYQFHHVELARMAAENVNVSEWNTLAIVLLRNNNNK